MVAFGWLAAAGRWRSSPDDSEDYIADRLTLDDPLHGYIVRSKVGVHAELDCGISGGDDDDDSDGVGDGGARGGKGKGKGSSSKTASSGGGGMVTAAYRDQPSILQGFIVVTTFATWQMTFRWDSLSPQAGITALERRSHQVGRR